MVTIKGKYHKQHGLSLYEYTPIYMLLTFCFQVELFTDLNEMKAVETIDVLEIGGGSGTNFKSFFL